MINVLSAPSPISPIPPTHLPSGNYQWPELFGVRKGIGLIISLGQAYEDAGSPPPLRTPESGHFILVSLSLLFQAV